MNFEVLKKLNRNNPEKKRGDMLLPTATSNWSPLLNLSLIRV